MTTALNVDAVSRSFDARQVLRGVSFTVTGGRMTVFVDAHGAGKTTTMRIILGVLAADQGELTWNGSPLTRRARQRFGDTAAIKFMAYLPLPLLAPIAMPVRVFGGHAAWWEPFVALPILAATAAATLLLGSRLYEGSPLRTNGGTSWVTAWKSRNAF